MNTAVITYLYPQGLKYTDRFLSSLKQQSFRNFKLIVFNDGVENPSEYFQHQDFETEFVIVSGTPTQIRFQSFVHLRQCSAENIIFQDIDDEMSFNRIEILVHYLNEYDIVSNDLTLIDEDSDIIEESIWSGRLGNSFIFDHEFIKEKNIAGIGNSGIRRTLLDTGIKFSHYPIVADWFMFYQYLFLTKAKVLFTGECQTLYRQHETNMAGIKKLDQERMNYVLTVKEAHYRGLIEIGFDFRNLLDEILVMKTECILPSGQNKEDNLFWWEETKYLVPGSR